LTRYGFVIDQTTCIGCHACTVACKTEHGVALGVNRTWVKYVEKGTWPDTKRFFSVMRCNHCTDAPCVDICPTTALFRRPDGIVDFDTSRCIGCKSCLQACPYDALYIDPGDQTAQKCNYCVHRVEVGLEPACVVVCPEQAIIAGDLDDPASRIAGIVATRQTSQRSVEQGTRPNLWYLGAEASNLDPLGAVDPGDGGLWRDPEPSYLGVDLSPDAAAAGPGVVYEHGGLARVVYTTDHPMPWGWRVSSYFLTKGIAAGLAIATAVALLGGAGTSSSLARHGIPAVAAVFLAATGALLVADLKRPERFVYLLTKGRWGSWLVKGAWILAGYGLLLVVWLVLGVVGSEVGVAVVAWLAAVIGLAVAGYTAFLFGQAEGRDLWQSPRLLWHMVAAAVAVGGGAGLVATLGFDAEGFEGPFALCLVAGCGAVGVVALTDLAARHPTRNAAEAAHHLMEGRYALEWWLGWMVLGAAVPIVLGIVTLAGGSAVYGAIGGAAAAAGVWCADDAFVRAGQSVPLS